MEPMDPKMKYLQGLMDYQSKKMAEELKAKYRPSPEAVPAKKPYIGLDGAPVEKVGPTAEDGLPEAEPTQLLADLDEEAIRKLLGEG